MDLKDADAWEKTDNKLCKSLKNMTHKYYNTLLKSNTYLSYNIWYYTTHEYSVLQYWRSWFACKGMQILITLDL